ncbi:MAG: hypothetical protein ABUK01_18835 [Leptospirales bacterium]
MFKVNFKSQLILALVLTVSFGFCGKGENDKSVNEKSSNKSETNEMVGQDYQNELDEALDEYYEKAKTSDEKSLKGLRCKICKASCHTVYGGELAACGGGDSAGVKACKDGALHHLNVCKNGCKHC